ncbi:Tyrosine-protein phosphatase 69D [Gryllus bimaculatus]|nr:Tyrosine-protein phosphatase 69D [Gryllus bimaculatus]
MRKTVVGDHGGDLEKLSMIVEISSDYNLGDNVTLLCKVPELDNLILWWTLDGDNVTEDERHSLDLIPDFTPESEFEILKLVISSVSIYDVGNYSCHAAFGNNIDEEIFRMVYLNIVVHAAVTEVQNGSVDIDDPATLACNFTGYPLNDIKWSKGEDGSLSDLATIENKLLNDTFITSVLEFDSVSRKDNGTYRCTAIGSEGEIGADVVLLVRAKPLVNIDFVTAVGARRLFLNWTVSDGNMPVQEYFIQHMKGGTKHWTYYQEKIGGGNTSYVLKNLEPNSTYHLRLSAKNAIGRSNEYTYPEAVSTLDKDPDFVPVIFVKGVTSNSITIGWLPPEDKIMKHVHYYQLVVRYNGTKKEALQLASLMNLPTYLFVDLKPATTYNFEMSACSEYTRQCGSWSETVNGTTMDGVSGPPENVSVVCKFDNVSGSSSVIVTWAPPRDPNGKIGRYDVTLDGSAVFKNERGEIEQLKNDPSIHRVDEKALNTHYNYVQPNTNYSVRVSAVTRTRKRGEEASGHCHMPPTVPDRDKLAHLFWGKLHEQGRWLFKLFLPRLSERNGPICCYRVFLVKLEPQQNIANLPSPKEFPLSTYAEVHQGKGGGGAYVAEMFDGDALNNEVFLGDDDYLQRHSSACMHCVISRPRASRVTTTTPTTTTTSTTTVRSTTTTTTTDPSAISLTNATPKTGPPHNPVSTADTFVHTASFPTDFVLAGPKAESVPDSTIVAPESTGSGPAPTVEIINSEPGSTILTPSSPTPVRMRRSELHLPYYLHHAATTPDSNLIRTVMVEDGILDIYSNYTGFVEVVVFGPNHSLLPAYSDYFEPLQPGPGPEALAASDTPQVLAVVLQVLCALVLVVLVLLVSLCLLQRYTKQVAEAQGVEMTLTNSFRHLCRSLRGRHVLVSSNPPDMSPISKAELAVAYVERHRDSDYGFQHEFELLPDRFPDRTTRHSEARENLYKNRYPDIKAYDQTRVRLSQIDSVVGSDYINANFVVGYKERKKFICAQGPMDNTVCDFWRMVWEQHLELILMLTNLEEYSKTKCAKYWPDEAEGEKGFGDISVAHVQEKRYSDYIIRELKMYRATSSSGREERSIVQYHYLVWKDFMAPEHPSGILKFIKRVNEAYSLEKGPILVHCSAGVGRTGTLVALDSLLQQLQEEGQVAIFNTVCDLRHQRNFLVQSLKQYIFIYRALMEVAQFGDTELKVHELKGAIEKLRQRENGKDKTKMEEDFEKINRVLEDRKSFSVGGGDENRMKNRNELVIPYDRNRVILTPIPGREHSTYINASFIEGYDNSESFIITQDPLELTIPDFWRMISEQSVSTLVMLSDLGDGIKKCLRYWPEDEIQHEYIHTDENVMVTQFQYNGWPTVEGEVPEVTRGLIELVDQTQSHQEAHGGSAPIVVHCRFCGSDRSSMFVALSILVQQLRTEKRVDIFTTTRKLRSQRHGMLQTFAQYEFLYRAIVNYADLHHLAGDEA